MTPYGGKRGNASKTCIVTLYAGKHVRRLKRYRETCEIHALCPYTEENAKDVLNDAETRVKHTHCNAIQRKTRKAS